MVLPLMSPSPGMRSISYGGQGIYSAALPERQSGGSLKAHSDRVSFDWEGDALELLNELARLRGTAVQLQRRPSPLTRLTARPRHDLC